MNTNIVIIIADNIRITQIRFKYSILIIMHLLQFHAISQCIHPLKSKDVPKLYWRQNMC